MGMGTKLAAEYAPEHAQVIDDFKDQLLIALVNKLGGEVSIPVEDIDSIGMFNMSLSITDGVFHFKTVKKQ